MARGAGWPRLAATLGAAALAVGGCSWLIRVQGFPYDRVERAPKPQDYPIPILDEEPRDRPYVVIGLVQAEVREVEGLLEREMREGLRREARRMGGDALIHLERQPSIRSVQEIIVDRELSERQGLWQQVSFRWVAEVISFDIPEGTLGGGPGAAPRDP